MTHDIAPSSEWPNKCVKQLNPPGLPKGQDGKWARKPLAYLESNIFNLCVIHPPEICVNLVFKHIHAASSYL